MSTIYSENDREVEVSEINSDASILRLYSAKVRVCVRNMVSLVTYVGRIVLMSSDIELNGAIWKLVARASDRTHKRSACASDPDTLCAV